MTMYNKEPIEISAELLEHLQNYMSELKWRC